MSGIVILAAIAALLAAFGVWRHLADGRMRAAARVDAPRLTPAEVGGELGDKATLVQFTSAFCAPCADMVPGVKHVDLDVEHHLDLARELNISRTPTVLVLDADGAIVRRASGQPRKADVIAALGDAMPA